MLEQEPARPLFLFSKLKCLTLFVPQSVVAVIGSTGILGRYWILWPCASTTPFTDGHTMITVNGVTDPF